MLEQKLMSINEKKKQILEAKIGECLGLERGIQKTVSEIDTKGLLSNPVIKKQLIGLRDDAKGHEDKMREMIDNVTESIGLNSRTMEDKAQITLEKVGAMMHAYLGEEYDLQEALEFLCLAKGGEVIYYEILNSLASKAKERKFGTEVRRILREERDHLKLCTSLAKQNVRE